MSEYSVRQLGAYTYRVVKFDDLGNPIIPKSGDFYIVERSREAWRCTCEGSNKHTSCRHRTIVQTFILTNRVGTGWMFDYDLDKWVPPYNFKVKERSP